MAGGGQQLVRGLRNSKEVDAAKAAAAQVQCAQFDCWCMHTAGSINVIFQSCFRLESMHTIALAFFCFPIACNVSMSWQI
mmetsp:Transcript_38254/g.73501  ORF Transcript_38254/g.73501 Transcript_38254/m.73501 type:complete len:80 (+) Transcript_38254:496-735(+)